MKLWKCTAFGADCEYFKLMVGEAKEEVWTRWEIELEDELIYGYNVEEIEEVEGYKINLIK